MCLIWCIAILLNIGYCVILHPVICNIKILVADGWCYMRGASCAAGVICLLVYYLYKQGIALDFQFNAKFLESR